MQPVCVIIRVANMIVKMVNRVSRLIGYPFAVPGHLASIQALLGALVMKQYIKKADIILLIVLVAVGLASTAYVAMSRSGGDIVIIERNGDMYGKYSLFEDKTITVEGKHSKNIITIKGGTVVMAESTCKNQVCVRHGAISSTGESIICLPNRVVVKIEGKGGGYDAISG